MNILINCKHGFLEIISNPENLNQYSFRFGVDILWVRVFSSLITKPPAHSCCKSQRQIFTVHEFYTLKTQCFFLCIQVDLMRVFLLKFMGHLLFFLSGA